MNTTQEPGAAPPARRITTSMITLDKSRAFSEIHGERTPDDPMYRVHSWQDDLPFDSEGRLVPDDGRDSPVTVNIDGRPTVFAPLYTKARRQALQRKIARLEKHMPEDRDDPVLAATAAREEEQQEIDSVNLVSWLEGDLVYEFRLVKEAIKKRYGKNVTTVAEAVVFLVNDEDARVASYQAVHDKYKKYLPAPE